MKILYLPLKKEWYNMIESGEKPEEYREIKLYWTKRLINFKKFMEWANKNYKEILYSRFLFPFRNPINYEVLTREFSRDYTHVRFSYGYTKRTMLFENKGISIGKGNPEWGAPKEDCYIIKLGERIS